MDDAPGERRGGSATPAVGESISGGLGKRAGGGVGGGGDGICGRNEDEEEAETRMGGALPFMCRTVSEPRLVCDGRNSSEPGRLSLTEGEVSRSSIY